MSLTLAANIGADATTLRVSGTLTADCRPGFRFRIDDEMLELLSFGLTRPPRREMRLVWNIDRGLEGSARAPHSSGAAIRGINDAYLSGSNPTIPGPFQTVGSFTKMPYRDPTTATPEQIINDEIAANLRDSS